MNIQQDIPRNHNADNRFTKFNAKLDEIEEAVFSAQELQHSSDKKVHYALCLTLDLGYQFKINSEENQDEWQLLKDFLIYHEERWSAKCEANMFHGLVSVAFNQIDEKGLDVHSAPTLSKYRAVLKYAEESEFSSKKLSKLLEEKTLDKVYQDAVSKARFDPIDNYVEDADERFERASKELLAQSSIPTIDFTSDITKPKTSSEFATAIVRLNGSSFDVVGFLEDETEKQIQAKVISLVPDEAKYARKKLKDKNLYQLYACCDLFKRFIPNIATLRSWNKAHKSAQLPELSADSSQENINDFIRALSIQRKAEDKYQEHLIRNIKCGQVSTVTKFMMLNALDFKIEQGTLIAASLTTHPSTPYLEFKFDQFRPKLQKLMPLMIKDMDALAFSKSFLESRDWSLKRKENGLVASSSRELPDQLHMQDYSKLASWRTIDNSLQSIGRYTLDKTILDRLSRWKSEHSETPKFTRITFQSILEVVDNGDTIDLVFPNNNTERRTLGTSPIKVQPNYQSKITKKRYFDIKQVNQLLELALDYRIHFEFELLEGHQGATALRFHCIGLPFEASITMPLLLSVKGNPTEITETI